MLLDEGGSGTDPFKDLGGCDPGDAALQALADFLTRNVQQSGDNTEIPAGYTYLGQFVSHDLNSDSSEAAAAHGRHAVPRTPRLDLDSVYGGGPEQSPDLYDGIRFKLAQHPGGIAHDVPRHPDGTAKMADPRNDENVIVAQLHVLFMRLHNRAADRFGDFQAARDWVCRQYQWVVLHDFLPRVVGAATAAEVLSGVSADPNAARMFARELIPLVFLGGAYRFGHSMVREEYVLRPEEIGVPLFSKRRRDEQTLAGGRVIPSELEIDWAKFFPLAREHQWSRRIDTSLAAELNHLADGRLPLLNLRSGVRLCVPSGQAVARVVVQRTGAGAPLTSEELDAALRGIADDELRAALVQDTPLWYYVLLEAQLRGRGGEHLGPIGGRIVAEVFAGVVEADRRSYVHAGDGWTPDVADMPALIRSAGV